jgi:hypothetical protein
MSDAHDPMPARLFCLSCGRRHLDEGEWAERPHRRHQCEHCRFRWIIEPPCYGAHDCDWSGCEAIAVTSRVERAAVGPSRLCAEHEAEGERRGYWKPLEVTTS